MVLCRRTASFLDSIFIFKMLTPKIVSQALVVIVKWALSSVTVLACLVTFTFRFFPCHKQEFLKDWLVKTLRSLHYSEIYLDMWRVWVWVKENIYVWYFWNLISVFSPCKAAASSMALHGSDTSPASADRARSGSETEDLVTPQVPYSGVHWHSDQCDSQP